MTTRSLILEELKREEMSLSQELSRVKPQQSGRASGSRGHKLEGVSEEEKKEIRKAKSRIAYKKRQLAQVSGGPLQSRQQVQDQTGEEEVEHEFVPSPPTQQRPRQQAPKRGSRAPAKKSMPLPPPPSGSGVQMVYVSGGDDLGYEESVECEDDSGGFEP